LSILVDKETRLLVQGITGGEGSFHTRRCVEYGTSVVAGVTPGKGGTDLDGIPVFNTVERAVKETGANTSIIFVPAPFSADSILEAIDAGISLVVCITEGILRQPASHGVGRSAHRAELPRPAFARQVQGWDHER